MHIQTHRHVYTYTHIYAHIHTYIYTHIHTHAKTSILKYSNGKGYMVDKQVFMPILGPIIYMSKAVLKCLRYKWNKMDHELTVVKAKTGLHVDFLPTLCKNQVGYLCNFKFSSSNILKSKMKSALFVHLPWYMKNVIISKCHLLHLKCPVSVCG